MSYGNSTNKRFELPPDYQEVLVIHEIQLSKGLSTDILRKMVYLYTTGMEYYNIMKKTTVLLNAMIATMVIALWPFGIAKAD